MTEKKRKPKATGPRTEVFAMRLDPKLKYLAEIAARKQRRSLANFIEWALDEALGKVKLAESADFNGQYDRSVLDEASKLWDLEPSDRLIKLAQNYPDLLTYEEQVIWKAIFEVTASVRVEGAVGPKKLAFYYGAGDDKAVARGIVHRCWDKLVAYAEGNATVEDVMAALIQIDSEAIRL